MEVILIILVIYLIGLFFEKSDYDRMKEAEKLPPFTKELSESSSETTQNQKSKFKPQNKINENSISNI